MSYKRVLSTDNMKMKATMAQHPDIRIVSFAIGACKRTCPFAWLCKTGCYVKHGQMGLTDYTRSANENLEMVDTGSIWNRLVDELIVHRRRAQKKNQTLHVRVHESGDFFSYEYLMAWFNIMNQFPDVEFYAYTKNVALFKFVAVEHPANFSVVYSYGGLQDAFINPETDRHAHVFYREEDIPEGYTNGSHDDSVAMKNGAQRIALVYHGPKKYAFSTWRMH